MGEFHCKMTLEELRELEQEMEAKQGGYVYEDSRDAPESSDEYIFNATDYDRGIE